MRIVVTGLAATYPLGGVFWDYVQYALGFMQMGHEVLYLEDSGKWCYDPAAETFVESGARNAEWFAAQLHRFDERLAARWFFRDPLGQTWGLEWPKVVEFCRTAEVFVHVSFSCRMRDEYCAARKLVFIDSDPMFTQASIPQYLAGRLTPEDPDGQRVATMLRHQVHFTFGENIAGADCRVPRAHLNWLPTRQPIVLECFRDSRLAPPQRRRVLTTVMSWESADRGPIIDGVEYGAKSREFVRFIDLPGRSPLPLEIAISGKAPRAELTARGWRLVEAPQACGDPWSYRDYLARSYGEWSIAKNAYVQSRSGWFSCRSACYLALGVPVIVQDTGFGCAVPTGRGVMAFATPDQAQAAIESVAGDPQRHSAAALEIADQYFAAARVLGTLLDRALSTSS